MSYSLKMASLAALGLTLLAAAPALAVLEIGAKAPDVNLKASLAGKEIGFSLAEALKKGPVVLYFYPAAFTPGCTAEAHDFAEATEKFAALGASVIGVSTNSIDTLHKFSVTECRNKFPVAADSDQAVTKAYDSVLLRVPRYSSRTSYVIAPDGKIAFVYSNLDAGEHVSRTLKAVEEWKAAH